MSSVFIDNIGELLTFADDGVGSVRNAALVVEDGRVAYAGPRDGVQSPSASIRVDAQGRLVTPGLIEPHAHPIFAGSRAEEFDLRARGVHYTEIQKRGGGILSTVRATRAASDMELAQRTLVHLGRFLHHGTTIVESKTGYALDVDGELRLLGILDDLKDCSSVDISPTLLLHVPDPEVDRKKLVDDFVQRGIPAAVGRAEAVDVYCDAGAFTLTETEVILRTAKQHGLALRVHAEQFTHTGAAELAAELGARSVEHLEELSDDAPKKLAAAGTVCTLLPGAALTLKLKFPDGRRLLDAGCTVAIGTDCNPGSSLSENQPLMMSLAVMQMGLSCAEAWRAVTVGAAKAVGRSDAGRLVVGSRGDVVIWNTDDHRQVPQHYGVNLVEKVFVDGKEQPR